MSYNALPFSTAPLSVVFARRNMQRQARVLRERMTDYKGVVTARMPADLVAQFDEVAKRTERTKNWIIREAVAQWLTEDQRRHELTVEALEGVAAGRTSSHEEVLERVALKKQSTRRRAERTTD